MNQINEALAAYRRWVDDEDVPDSELVARVITAHERAKRDWITCPTCTHTTGGRGMHCDMCSNPCPDCVDGMTPSPDSVRRGWRELVRRGEMTEEAFRAGLLASRREGETR